VKYRGKNDANRNDNHSPNEEQFHRYFPHLHVVEYLAQLGATIHNSAHREFNAGTGMRTCRMFFFQAVAGGMP
jgi:hypothetical protein